MKKPREDEAVNVLQEFSGCRLIYDLTAHRIEVTGPDGDLLLRVQPLPDNPGGFDLANEGQYIEVHNPGSVDFTGVHDQYDDNKALYG